MKTPWLSALLLTTLVVAGCAPTPAALPTQTAAPATETPAPTAALFHTSIGDFEIVEARYVDDVNGTTPLPDMKILLIEVTQPGQERLDPSSFSLEAFDGAIHDLSEGETHVSGDDGSYSISTMSGWLDQGQGDFVIGFQVPAAASRFTFVWPGNEPIELKIAE